ncbi:exonuclease domain-containing protein [Galbibacter pacificus]|uniref:Exonuclease domain-containing protein n=1 Tax=Galbibacter pacificus TaxID=2996052 RepID=A0ABT6FQE6_9FLAO|nr:exonuclease domain-containing protein [Galbibacter pacificus]MDG3582203.1 exonuclease domain-containing protein [Galbibacter pacificus]MDG3585321.1 exonuclease domain-containing protein [Galbibacter pacificus]
MYAILDIETTGGKYNEEGITEIAIYRFDGHTITDQFISLVNPEKEIQPFVVKLTGINNAMLQTAPKFFEIAKRVVEITENCTLVAHNAQFDYRILQTEFKRLGYDYQRKSVCTVELAKELIPEQPSYSLGKLVRSLGIPVSDRHRANGDAQATVKLFKMLLTKDASKKIIQNNIRAENVGQLNPRLIDIVERLPNAVGVFYMHDLDGKIMFLAKSRNIQKRVNQIFVNTSRKFMKIQKEVRAVTYDETGNELIALLKENSEVNLNKPPYNKKSKKLFTHGLYLSEDKNGYLSLKIKKAESTGNCVTTFSNYQQAYNFLHKLDEEFELCNKLNGLSEAKKNCYNYTIGKCKGACICTEPTQTYNKRVKKAIFEYSINHKTMLIIDKGRNASEHSFVFIEGGDFKGIGYFDLNHQINNIEIVKSILAPMQHTKNAKHLIHAYIRKKRNLKKLNFN